MKKKIIIIGKNSFIGFNLFKFFKNNKIKYKKNLDYFLTNFINYFI